MSKKLPKIDQAQLGMIVRGAEKTFDNAEKLYFEAELLAKSGALARALCMHQISLEECSKVETFGAWAASIISGLDADQTRIIKAFRLHSSKNKNNAYFLPASDIEKAARERGDWDAAMTEFKHRQNEFHKSSNDAKNASLYVDWLEGEFVSPSERISVEMLNDIIERNQEFLGIAYNSLKMLKRIGSDPTELQDLIVGFIESAEKLRAENPGKPPAGFDDLLQNFLNSGLERARKKPGKDKAG